MSANNQTLIKEYKGKWYVFASVNAESWEDEDGSVNELPIKWAASVHDNLQEAYKAAQDLEAQTGEFEEGTEYGIGVNQLVKDNGEVRLIE